MNALVSALTNFVLWSPLVSILVFSLLVTIGVSFLYKKLTNKEEFDKLKSKQKTLREEMKEHKGNPTKMAEIQKEMMQSSLGSMKLTIKPMLISFVPLMLIIYGLRRLYMELAVVGNISPFIWSRDLPIVGTGGGWFFCYIVFSLICSIILRKVFKLY